MTVTECDISRWTQDFFVRQHSGDFIRPVAVDGHLEDAPHDGGAFFVYDPNVFIVRAFAITVYRRIGQMLAVVAFGVKYRFYFAARISRVPFAENVEECCTRKSNAKTEKTAKTQGFRRYDLQIQIEEIRQKVF